MAKFITRIELHNAGSDDYEKLHEEMEKEGFEKTITSSDGKEYSLPDGEYHYDKQVPINPGKEDYQIVLEKAKKAAQKTNKKFGVITSRKDVSTWDNLKEVK